MHKHTHSSSACGGTLEYCHVHVQWQYSKVPISLVGHMSLFNLVLELSWKEDSRQEGTRTFLVLPDITRVERKCL